MLNRNVTKVGQLQFFAVVTFVPMLNHNVTKDSPSEPVEQLSFVPMLNHNVTKGQNSFILYDLHRFW